MGCGSNGQADALLSQQKQLEMAQNNAVGQVNNAFSGFTPDFYKGIGTAYQNYAMPQLQQQYQNSSNQLGFKLAGQGLGDSSQAQFLGSQLANTMSQGQTQIGQEAVNQENQLKQQVSQEQANLVGQASSSQNPNYAGAQALGVAQGFGTPSTFAPIGNLFNQFGQQYLGSQVANTYGTATNNLNQNQFGVLNPFSSLKAY